MSEKYKRQSHKWAAVQEFPISAYSLEGGKSKTLIDLSL